MHNVIAIWKTEAKRSRRIPLCKRKDNAAGSLDYRFGTARILRKAIMIHPPLRA